MTPELQLIDYLHNQLTGNQSDLDENNSYYDADQRLKAIGVAVPQAMRVLLARVGWPGQYLRNLADRSTLEGFRMGGKPDDRLWQWWKDNRLPAESRLLHIEAMKHGRAYASIAAPDRTDPLADPETPLIRVESPKNMWVEEDPVTRRVRHALRVYKGPNEAQARRSTLLLPDATLLCSREGVTGPWKVDRAIEHGLGAVPVVPFYNNVDLHERKGHSEMSQPLRDFTDAASRLFMTMATAAELLAVPQRLLLNVAEEALKVDPADSGAVLELYLSRIITVDSDNAQAFQWAAAELRNFVDGLQEVTRFAAAETGMPPEYLALTSDNPASAEAIQASESRMVKNAENKNVVWGDGWEQVMRISLLVMDGAVTPAARRLESIWRNPATPTFAAQADASVKLATSSTPDGRPVMHVEQVRSRVGMSPEEQEEAKRLDKESSSAVLAALARPAFREPGAPAKPQGEEAA